MGCSRVGAAVAEALDADGHDVTVLDRNARAFRKLPDSFSGERLIGNGMDTRTLERAGIQRADAFFAVTQGDNRNYFSSQLAREVYRVPRVLCRTYDPQREEIFRKLGIETYSPTRKGSEAMLTMFNAEKGTDP
jgi:trk/ktr system potassium uptake protein